MSWSPSNDQHKPVVCSRLARKKRCNTASRWNNISSDLCPCCNCANIVTSSGLKRAAYRHRKEIFASSFCIRQSKAGQSGAVSFLSWARQAIDTDNNVCIAFHGVVRKSPSKLLRYLQGCGTWMNCTPRKCNALKSQRILFLISKINLWLFCLCNSIYRLHTYHTMYLWQDATQIVPKIHSWQKNGTRIVPSQLPLENMAVIMKPSECYSMSYIVAKAIFSI